MSYNPSFLSGYLLSYLSCVLDFFLALSPYILFLCGIFLRMEASIGDFKWTSSIFQIVGSTRGTPEGFRTDQASGSQQPAPPPPNLAEVKARQTELLDQLVQAQQNQFRHQQRGRDEPPSASYQDFFSTQPPLFHKIEEPLDADAWLHTIESKFGLLSTPCSKANKALFVARQLRGIALIWWDHYYAMQPDGHVVTWEEFWTAFRAHHIPEGLIEWKLNEFLALTQGN
jgi:hypothetical protein